MVAACGDDSPRPALLEWFTRAPQDAAITVHFTTGWCDKVSAPSVKETPEQVVVTIPVEAASADQPCESIAPKGHDVVVELSQTLGNRSVRGPTQPGVARERVSG